jgi:RimJ/RimL family protein N-acetyltransferase
MNKLSFSHITLSTERLVLRAFEKNDVEVLFRMNSDSEVLRWTTWKKGFQSIHEAEQWIDSVYSEQYAQHGYGRLAVMLRENDELIGWSGVKFDSDKNTNTLGYRFLKEHWGKGYATEAAKVSVLHAFHTIGLEDVSGFIISENKASRHVLEKAGFVSTGINFTTQPRTVRFTKFRDVDFSFHNKPLFTSENLAFHEITEEDAGVMYALNCDPEVVQYTGDTSFISISAAENFLADRREENKKIGYGRWKILLRQTGECIGWCGLKFHADQNVTDVGYRLFRRHWGNGYATEAAKASIEYGFSILKLNRIVAHARKENIGSLRVLEKCGMKIIGEGLECGGEIFVFEIKRLFKNEL